MVTGSRGGSTEHWVVLAGPCSEAAVRLPRSVHQEDGELDRVGVRRANGKT